MSIRTGRNGYSSIAEFAERTRQELADPVGVLFKRDTEPPEDDVRWVRERLSGHRRVLELGCGFGVWATVADGLGCQYWGVDPVPERIEYAAQHNSGERAVFVCGNATAVRLGATFDAVLFVTVLQHMTLDDACTSLQTAAVHLEPDGVAYLIESGIHDETESECERLYLDRSEHMIPKPLAVLQAAVPDFNWANDGRFDRWILTKGGA